MSALDELINICAGTEIEFDPNFLPVIADAAAAELAQLRKLIENLKMVCDSAGIQLQYQAGELAQLRAERDEIEF